MYTETRNAHGKNYAFVPLSGCLDEKTLPEFVEKIEPLVEGDHSYLVLDLGELDLMSSRAVGYLENIHRKLEATEKRLAFVNANEEVQEILELIGLAKLVQMFEAEENFLEAMGNEEI